MATATAERPAAAAAKPLMKFRLLSGGFDQIDPAYSNVETGELRRGVLKRRGIVGKEDEDSKAEVAAVSAMTRPELLRELGAFQRFRANAATGEQPIVESDRDLVKQWGRQRFDSLSENQSRGERIVEKVVERRVAVDLEEMSLEDLRAFAAEEEIELLADADSKPKVLAVIRRARKAK